MTDDKWAWQKDVALAVMHACLGQISSSMECVWVDFHGDRDFTIHFAVSESSGQVIEDVEDILVDAMAPIGPQHFGEASYELHESGARPSGSPRTFFLIYIAKLA